jgi:hypothetical protein
VAEIADNLAEDVDDDFRDPDYAESDSDSGSGSDSEDEAGGEDEERGEVRVYMQPPVERADADTDVDSGRFVCLCAYCLSFYTPVVPVFFDPLSCKVPPFLSVFHFYLLSCIFFTPLPVFLLPYSVFLHQSVPVFFHPLACIFCTHFHSFTHPFCLSF